MRIVIGRWRLEDEETRLTWGSQELSAGFAFKGEGRHDEYHLELPLPEGWTPLDLFTWSSEELLRFRIFPPNRMKAFVDSPNGRLEVGTTILLGIYVGPFRLQMADRVLDVFKGETTEKQWAGFTYGTLQGHVEKGIETFQVTLDKGSSRVIWSMEAWSKPGHWLTYLFYPWARVMQKKAAREVLEYMKTRLREKNKIEGG